jgi:hypothetical protein
MAPSTPPERIEIIGLGPLGAALVALVLTPSLRAAVAEEGFAFTLSADRLAITHSGQPVATYVFRDEKIPRPYLAHLHAPGGVRVTRNHPPIPGRDATDHDALHPGLWLAFGDLGGHDFWRNRAVIRHGRFVEPPVIRDGRLAFSAEDHLLAENGPEICRGETRMTFDARPSGYLLIWETTYSSDRGDFSFGDQEEMGLGVRVATPLAEKNGGLIVASTGAKTAGATWGKAFDWCDCSGVMGERRAGVTLMPDPANFRPSWFHNRDYGLMVANPFGRKAMGQGDTSRVTVKKGERLRLRFGVLLHSAPRDVPPDPAAAYRDFLDRLPGEGDRRSPKR